MSATLTARQTIDRQMSEKELHDLVVGYARLRGWLVYFTHDSRHSPEGFPDLVLTRADSEGMLSEVQFIELKTEKGQPTAEQYEWLDTLTYRDYWGNIRNNVWLFRPSDWEVIEKVLF